MALRSIPIAAAPTSARATGCRTRLPASRRSSIAVRCARNLLDLVYELTAAMDSHDVNRVAGLYHWVGMSSSGAVSVMDRLDMIAQRPLVDIVPVYPASAQGEGDYYPQATVRRAPIGLRLEQTLSNGSTPSRTMLGLRRYLGCWWVHL